MESLKIAVILSSIAANLGFGLLVLHKNSRNIVNLTLAGFALTFALWSLSLFFYDYPVILNSLFWIKSTYLAVIFGLIGFIYYFGYIFPHGKKPPFLGQLSFFLLALLLGGSLIFTDYFVKDVVVTQKGPQTVLGPIYPLFIIFDSIFGFWGLGMLIKKYLGARGRIKGQLKYIFLGITLFIIVVLILDAIIPMVSGNSGYFSISTVGSLFFVGLAAYATIRHHLLDIRIAMQEVMSHVLTTFIIGTVSFGSAMIYWLIVGSPFKGAVFVVTLAVGAVLSLFFDKAVKLSKLIVSTLMRQPFYDFEKTVLEISLSLASSLELNKLVDVICSNLIKHLGIEDAAIILSDGNYKASRITGFPNGLKFLDSSVFLSYILTKKKMISLEEGTPSHQEEELFKEIESSGAALIIPWFSTDKFIGLLVLGNKNSGDPFTAQDIDFINTISFQSLNAIQNAISYEKSKEFNVVLTKEVNKATADLRAANQKLQVLDRLKDDFVSIASHELRTPMTAIRSYAWMALHRSDVPLSKTLEKYIARILISTERLVNLVNDMLNISRIESGKIEIVPEPVDLLSLIRDIVDEVYYSKSEEKKIEFVVAEKNVPKAFADPEKLRQVFLNLVGNSLKFTPDGGKISFDFFSDGISVEISVSDTGVGMSKEDLSKLFQKFSRLDNSYTAAATSGGTGLGLYISKNLVELMHGKIKASSEGAGKGSTFTVTLPIATPDVIKDVEKYTVRAAGGQAKSLEPAAI